MDCRQRVSIIIVAILVLFTLTPSAQETTSTTSPPTSTSDTTTTTSFTTSTTFTTTTMYTTTTEYVTTTTIPYCNSDSDCLPEQVRYECGGGFDVFREVTDNYCFEGVCVSVAVNSLINTCNPDETCKRSPGSCRSIDYCASDSDCHLKTIFYCNGNTIWLRLAQYGCVSNLCEAIGDPREIAYQECGSNLFCDQNVLDGRNGNYDPAACTSGAPTTTTLPSTTTTSMSSTTTTQPPHKPPHGSLEWIIDQVKSILGRLTSVERRLDNLESSTPTTNPTTTTATLPPAATCLGRSASGSARGPSDCMSLPCGRVSGGRTYSCQYVPEERNRGHCACKQT